MVGVVAREGEFGNPGIPQTSRISCSLDASFVDIENQHGQNDLETAAESHI